eukprot:scaffold26107_cov64-Phaeocystis_antarctica.AAC.1
MESAREPGMEKSLSGSSTSASGGSVLARGSLDGRKVDMSPPRMMAPTSSRAACSISYATPASAIIGTQRQRGRTGPAWPAGRGWSPGPSGSRSDGQLSASRG